MRQETIVSTLILILLLKCLTEHTGLSLVLFGENIMWCHYSSCYGRCGLKATIESKSSFSTCWCDHYCLNRGDCCIDYELACVHLSNDSEFISYTSDSSNRGNHNLISHASWLHYVRNERTLVEKALMNAAT